MKHLSACLSLALILWTPHTSFAGTGTGCAGDQWDNSPTDQALLDEGIIGNHTISHTSTLWEITAPGDNQQGCGTVSARSKSDTEVAMNNEICAFSFTAKSARLTIRSMQGKECSCAGTFPMNKSCSKGQID